MPQKLGPFSFDCVLSLNASLRVRECLPAIESTFREKKFLAGILNHRFFDLYDKNLIKGTVEAHNLDHIMFSMRPSSQRLVSAMDQSFIEKFKDLSQIAFVLQLMGRYKIPTAIVDSGHLGGGDVDTAEVGAIEPIILAFLAELSDRCGHINNVSKQFPWLYSIKGLLPEVRNCELSFFSKFERQPLSSSAASYNDNQITPLEKDLYWIGFDANYKQPPLDKPFPDTRWTDLAKSSDFGKPLFDGKIRYCARCCLPETMEGISFDEAGICSPCRSSEEKMHINWEQREEVLRRVIDTFRSEDYYDCMLPTSGGKDSTYQAHILHKIYGATPLAVTHGHAWLSCAGRYNLENSLQKFDQDHIMFIVNRRTINKVAKKSLGVIGDSCWHCHIGAGAFPIQTAVAWGIGLMIWGESIAEADGRGSYYNQTPEASPFYNLEISARVRAQDMADEEVPEKDLIGWFYPERDRLEASNLKYIHLGNYFFWDEERQVEFIKRNYEWMEAPVENTYKGFKSVECVMAGVHDYSNFIKRGIGRATIHAAADVKRGLLTREEGFELAKIYDTQRPHALDYYLQITGQTEREFEDTLLDAREKSEYAKLMKKYD